MGVVYHGSKEHGLTRLEPRKSTHGKYVYATPEKVLAVHFSGRCGDDLTYDNKKNVDTMWDGGKVYFSIFNNANDALASEVDITYKVVHYLKFDDTTCFVFPG